MFGGLLGVVYADVVQFGIMITGCTVFFVLAVTHNGGWHEIIHRVQEIRPAGLWQTPPSPSIGVLTLVVLFLQRWFFAGSPTAGEGMTAQRFMAAKNERHAVGGQLFNAVLALSFRTLPLIGLGIVAMSPFWTSDPQAKLGEAPAGMIQVFRRGDSIYRQADLKLQGLDPDKAYAITDLDTNALTRKQGRELMEQGFMLEITKKPGAALLIYRVSP